MQVRPADPKDVDPLAAIWHEAWHETHARLVPRALTEQRTLESLRARLIAALTSVRVVGDVGAPLGFCIAKDDELYQLFVAPAARGSGAAVALLADGEARLAANGVLTAWLACAIGNERAARFYEKHGWRRIGTMVNHAETSNGTFPLEVWRYEKVLQR
ncbi:MAG TPA: GNAT family N-acetyltransferase [Gemmatimonadales bacterium]|nr:GNAT family N-acetyltransferase [Gemmatimonadales bacterium]